MQEFLEAAIEKKISALKSGQGIRGLSDYVEIGRAKEGFVTSVLEVCFEEAKGQHYIRLRVTSFNGSGKSGKSRKAFGWPINDPFDLSDLAEITGKLIAACQPDAVVNDPRSGIGKAFDKLTGSRLINTIPELANGGTELNESLSCIIREDKYGRHISLTYKVPKRAPMYLRIPYPVWESFHAFVTA